MDQAEKQIAELDAKVSRSGFWDDPEAAQLALKTRSALADKVEQWRAPARRVENLLALVALVEEEGEDPSLVEEFDREVESLEESLRAIEVSLMLGGPDDERNAFLSIHPGAGGTESQDWAEMLLRMYLRWAERKGYRTELIEYQGGEEAGLKSVTVLVSGNHSFGYLKAEAGVHRLVRISPFDAGRRRHTSFASVFVSPEVDEDIEVIIREEDLRIDTYRSSGAGGQHVNVTDSAVRITHIPTGIVVQCQNERSQHKNRAFAMKVLRSRLYELESERRRQEREAKQGEKKEIAWGSQVRSYVLHPYQLIKDHRTAFERGNVDAVLDGDLDGFIEAYLLAGSK